MIIVAGNQALFLDLSEHLPPSARVSYCASAEQVVGRAAGATAVIIDPHLGTDWSQLCWRLRRDPRTSATPLLIYGDGSPPPEVGAEVLAEATATRALEALKHHCPQLFTASDDGGDIVDELAALDDADFLEGDPSASLWHRSETTDQWPEPPPRVEGHADMLSFAESYAAYVDSLIDGHRSSAELTPDQRERLLESSRAVARDFDAVLGQTQRAIDDALRSVDLERMRQLSSAKNAIFDRLKALRALLGDDSAPGAERQASPAAAAAATAEPAPAAPPPAPASRSMSTSSPPAREPSGPVLAASATPPTGSPAASHDPLSRGRPRAKSQLTLAAEAKQRERERKRQQRHSRPQAPVGGSARRSAAAAGSSARRAGAARAAGPSSGWSSRTGWLLAVAVAACAGGAWYVFGGSGGAKSAENSPPQMKFVTIQQTPGGVVARPRADDAEDDRISYDIRWLVDGAAIEGARSPVLGKQHYRPGSRVVVQVVPRDARAAGRAMRSQELVIVAE